MTARVVVADNGTGIPPGEVDKIFEVFASTKGSRGTGLGPPGLAEDRPRARRHRSRSPPKSARARPSPSSCRCGSSTRCATRPRACRRSPRVIGSGIGPWPRSAQGQLDPGDLVRGQVDQARRRGRRRGRRRARRGRRPGGRRRGRGRPGAGIGRACRRSRSGRHDQAPALAVAGVGTRRPGRRIATDLWSTWRSQPAGPDRGGPDVGRDDQGGRGQVERGREGMLQLEGHAQLEGPGRLRAGDAGSCRASGDRAACGGPGRRRGGSSAAAGR